MLLSLLPFLGGLLPEDALALERLFALHRCQHVFLDLGANIGVNIRKLYEPDKYPGAPALRLFNETFGPSRCRVCSIALEPNPMHATRLAELAQRYQQAGVGVLVIGAAVSSDTDGVTQLRDHNRTDRWIVKHGGTRLQISAQVDEAGNATASSREITHVRVPKVDLALLLHAVDRQLVRRHGPRQRDAAAGPLLGRVGIKMDIEGTEARVLPHLLAKDAMCLVRARHKSRPRAGVMRSVSAPPAPGRSIAPSWSGTRGASASRRTFWRRSSAGAAASCTGTLPG